MVSTLTPLHDELKNTFDSRSKQEDIYVTKNTQEECVSSIFLFNVSIIFKVFSPRGRDFQFLVFESGHVICLALIFHAQTTLYTMPYIGPAAIDIVLTKRCLAQYISNATLAQKHAHYQCLLNIL